MTIVAEEPIDADPGQFVMLWLPAIDEKPISLVDGDPLTVTVADVGAFSHGLMDLASGDLLHVRGPIGLPFRLEGSRILLVGGGYGVGPMLYLGQRATKAGVAARAVVGARNAEEVLFESRFEAAGIPLTVTTDDGSRGARGLATDAAEVLLDAGEIDAVYSCGPEMMMRRLAELCAERRVPCFLSIERYMKCGGMNLCGACEINGVLVCSEGPVLEGSRLLALPDFGLSHRDATAAKQTW